MVEPRPKPSLRERFNISRWAIQSPWLTISFWLAVSVAGLFALSSLRYALFPDVTFPVVVVNASAPIASALDTESTLTVPIEQELEEVAGVTDVDSTTYPGRSVVSLRFQVGSDLAASTEEVEAALADLEFDAEASFSVIPVNLNEASVASYAIESETLDLEELSEITEAEIVPAIEALPGVLRVDLLGVPAAIDPTQPPSIEQLLTQGATIVRFNGNSALAIQIIKEGAANTLEVADAVADEINVLGTELPNVQLTLAATQADYIRSATQATIRALIEAIILSILIIYPFLRNWRATLISALAIPISLLGTFIVMAIYGFNLETITLLALAMVIGILIDDAIVDVENVSRHIDRGEPPRQAAIASTNEVGLAVIATTAVAVAVFLPIGTMRGVLGQFFTPFGITISAALIISTMVARTLSPSLAAYLLKPRRSPAPEAPDSTPPPSTPLANGYHTALSWALHHRGMVILLALLSFIAGLALIPLIPTGFIPQLDRGEFNILYTTPQPEIPPEFLTPQQAPPQLPPGQLPPPTLLFDPLAESLEVAEELDEFVLESSEVETVFTIVGSRQGETNRGRIYVRLRDDRTLSTAEVQAQLREELPDIPGVVTSVEDIQFVDTGGGQPVQVRIVGEDLEQLDETAQAIEARLSEIPGFEDVTATQILDDDDTVVAITRSNGERIATIGANLGQGFTIGEAGDRATQEVNAILPAGISLELGGDSAQVDEVLEGFRSALSLSLVCILLVLLVLFRSVVDTLVIFLSLPLAIVGAMLGLLLVQSDFGMISLIGIIFLLGLTNKNAILIVDYIKQLRKSGMDRRQAILEAVPTRLRPILMTTASTILGMLPLALGVRAGVELRAQWRWRLLAD
ncbi:efflux RND transporter permease subunit [Egbenema bharatensis]|uniref:efflux RND transporter permease subunit n=1 Tax=Egbenema bharatensis TaxID=3463334 RepID=UPI003A8B48CE